MKTDLLIFGSGLTAHVLAHKAEAHGLNVFLAGSPEKSNCSRIAAGIWNPVVFKRLTKSWMIDELLPELKSFYPTLEKKLNTSFYHEREIIKPVFSKDEETLWNKKLNGELKNYLSDILPSAELKVEGCRLAEKYGLVKNAGNIDMEAFLSESLNYFKSKDQFLNEDIDYSEIKVDKDIHYRHIKANYAVFCEGYLVKKNPFFNWVPLKPVKGEVFEIKAEGIYIGSSIFNHNGFLMPLKIGHFKVGATYEWDHLDDKASAKGTDELKEKLKKLTTANYSILNHKAGVRPSSIDRRPIIGRHPDRKQLHIFNGLGTKGVMLAPFFAENFINFILGKADLHPEVNVSRFYPH